MQKNKIQETINKIATDNALRVEITRRSHFWFFHIYLPHYINYPTAPFQKEIIKMTEDESIKNLVIVAFRGSAKSTLATTSYVLWSVLGIHQKKCVVIASQTAQQAKMHILNIKRELESNELLKNDLGPFREEDSPWGMSMLVFSKYNAMIIPLSTEQTIRGNRFGQFRPDLIIGDDLENDQSVRTLESRNKTYDWLKNEVIPAGDKNTRMIIVGNLLHEDSLVMRLKEEIESEKLSDAAFRKYPIYENKDILWLGKFPTFEDIEAERRRIGNSYSWNKEYLLNIVSREGQVIPREWIKYYDELPKDKDCYRGIYVGIDLAISTKDTADYTALVVGLLCEIAGKNYIYILPNPINKRMTFKEILDTIKSLYESLIQIYDYTVVCVENNGFQDSVVQILTEMEIDCKGVRSSADKRCRLMVVSNYVQSGQVLFPRQGTEQLISQLVNFGVEKHDDLADGFSIALHEISEVISKPVPFVGFA